MLLVLPNLLIQPDSRISRCLHNSIYDRERNSHYVVPVLLPCLREEWNHNLSFYVVGISCFVSCPQLHHRHGRNSNLQQHGSHYCNLWRVLPTHVLAPLVSSSGNYATSQLVLEPGDHGYRHNYCGKKVQGPEAPQRKQRLADSKSI